MRDERDDSGGNVVSVKIVARRPVPLNQICRSRFEQHGTAISTDDGVQSTLIGCCQPVTCVVHKPDSTCLKIHQKDIFGDGRTIDLARNQRPACTDKHGVPSVRTHSLNAVGFAPLSGWITRLRDDAPGLRNDRCCCQQNARLKRFDRPIESVAMRSTSNAGGCDRRMERADHGRSKQTDTPPLSATMATDSTRASLATEKGFKCAFPGIQKHIGPFSSVWIEL